MLSLGIIIMNPGFTTVILLVNTVAGILPSHFNIIYQYMIIHHKKVNEALDKFIMEHMKLYYM